MNIQTQIQQVELSLAEAKKVKAFGEAIERLEKNRDFRTVILDGYFTDESRRLTFLTAEENLDEAAMQHVYAGIRAIGELRKCLMARKQMAQVMEKEIRDHEETLDELRKEDAGEEL